MRLWTLLIAGSLLTTTLLFLAPGANALPECVDGKAVKMCGNVIYICTPTYMGGGGGKPPIISNFVWECNAVTE